MYNQRAGGGSPLQFEDAAHRARVESIGAEAVHRFGRKRDQFTVADPARGLRQLLGRNHYSGSSSFPSLPSPTVFPVLRHTSHAWIRSSMSPSRTRSTSPTV